MFAREQERVAIGACFGEAVRVAVGETARLVLLGAVLDAAAFVDERRQSRPIDAGIDEELVPLWAARSHETRPSRRGDVHYPTATRIEQGHEGLAHPAHAEHVYRERLFQTR